MEAGPVGSLEALRKGDAVIVFSRRDVLYWATELTGAGFSVATIYGNLSPEVRQAQAQAFREGQADILVATDAIGMGLNSEKI
jgi:ATP-dependent RNA helicase SUPV3L1/SUV3